MKILTITQMIDFAVFCGRTHKYDAKGLWYSKDESELVSTVVLLDRWTREQVPHLPDPNDLKDVRFGLADLDNAREEGFKAGYKDATGKDKIYY